MDPSNEWYFRTYFDFAENGFGFTSNSLQPTDCPALAYYFDLTLANNDGSVLVIPQSICVFERFEAKSAWMHIDFVGPKERKQAQTLVVRQIATIGNYDYIMDVEFDQTGSVTFHIAATGLVNSKGVLSHKYNPSDPRSVQDTLYGRLVKPNLVSPYHDHFFSIRMDLDIDGQNNIFVKEELVPTRLENSPRKSIWQLTPTVYLNELNAQLNISIQRPSIWSIQNPNKQNSQGYNVGYEIHPMGSAISLLSPDDYPQIRGGFSKNNLWITAYDPNEKYAVALHPNQNPKPEGLPTYVQQARSIENTDIVAWYTLGLHHVVRTEDFPVMPTAWCSMTLRAYNFYDYNPALGLPDTQPLFAEEAQCNFDS